MQEHPNKTIIAQIPLDKMEGLGEDSLSGQPR
jgi:hypothetical protein